MFEIANENKYFFEITSDGDYIKIEVLNLNFENADSDWDKNSLNTNVFVKAGAFTGNFNVAMMTTEFESFRKELEKLNEKLDGIAIFHNLEGNVEIKIFGDGIGHLYAKCIVMDFSNIGNKLIFNIDFDQTYLPKLIYQLNSISNKFPKIGNL